MAEIICPQCKTPNRGTAQFCSECGTPLLEGLDKRPDDKKMASIACPRRNPKRETGKDSAEEQIPAAVEFAKCYDETDRRAGAR